MLLVQRWRQVELSEVAEYEIKKVRKKGCRIHAGMDA